MSKDAPITAVVMYGILNHEGTKLFSPLYPHFIVICRIFLKCSLIFLSILHYIYASLSFQFTNMLTYKGLTPFFVGIDNPTLGEYNDATRTFFNPTFPELMDARLALVYRLTEMYNRNSIPILPHISEEPEPSIDNVYLS